MENFNVSELASKFVGKIGKTKAYNLFEEWHMSENDHTKLLLAILRYYNGNSYPILHSFLTRFAKGRGKMIHYKRPENVEIKFNNGFIDGLITFTINADTINAEKFAIIIENKIYDAADQKGQVRRYISSVKTKMNVPLNNIWVFYITGDGSKEICKDSYDVENAKPEINIGSRFVALNYSDDILTWLRTDVLNCRVYPESLTSVVRVYVDYLQNGLFGVADEEDQKELFKILKFSNYLEKSKDLKKLDEENIDALYELRSEIRNMRKQACCDVSIDSDEAINTLYSVVSAILKRIESLAFDKFEEVSVAVLNKYWDKKLKELDKQGKVIWRAAHRGNYLQLRLVDEWNTVHLEWHPIEVKDMLFSNKYRIVFHVENGVKERESLKKKLKEKLKDDLVTKLKDKQQNIKNGKAVIWEYNKEIEKPFAQMTEGELEKSLTELYDKEMKSVFKLLVDNYKDYKI